MTRGAGPTARGFTLLELLVALVLVGVVALLVYGILGVGTDVERRVRDRQEAARSELAFRGLLRDALRNARPPRGGEAAALALVNGVDAEGRPADAVAFLAAGSTPPLTWEMDWRLRLAVGPEGAELLAAPRAVRSEAVRVARLEEVRGMQVRVLARAGDPWRETWDLESMVPRAVSLQFWDEEGPRGEPLTVFLPRGSR